MSSFEQDVAVLGREVTRGTLLRAVMMCGIKWRTGTTAEDVAYNQAITDCMDTLAVAAAVLDPTTEPDAADFDARR